MPRSTRTGAPPSLVAFYDIRTKGEDAHGRKLEEILKWDDLQLEMCHDYIQILFPLPEGSMFSFNAPVIDRKTLEAFRSSIGLRLNLCSAFIRMLSFYGFSAIPDAGEATMDQTDDQTTLNTNERDDTSADVKEKDKAKVQITISQLEAAADETTPDGDASASEDTVMLAEQLFDRISKCRIIRAENFERAAGNWAVRVDHNHLRITRIIRSLRVLGLQIQAEAFYQALKDVYNDPSYSISDRSMMFWERAARQPLHIAPDGTKVRWLLDWMENEQTQD